MKIKLIASDLDGTILQNGERNVDEALFTLIKELTEHNQLFVIASGRQYDNLRRLFDPVSDQISYICENGALVIHQNEVLFKQIMDKELGEKLISDILAYEGCEVLISGEHTSYLLPKSDTYLIYIRDILKNNVQVIQSIDEIREDYLKISLYHMNGITEEMKQHFNSLYKNQLKIATAGHDWMDFTNIECNKGEAIKVLQHYLNLHEDEM